MRRIYVLRQAACCALLLIVLGCARMPENSPSAQPTAGSPIVTGTPLTVPAANALAVPVRLIIPSIQVDAAIEPVGVLSNGDLDTPRQHPWNDVGWYTAGPRPGERGSAVLDGHLDRPGGFPAVFWNLHSMQVGDTIKVQMSSGRSLLFHVTRVAAYPPQDAPLQAIFGDSGGNYLNLITCAGDWIPWQHQTALRMVVFASSA
jgi:sortase (surface protein transpeptidase)